MLDNGTSTIPGNIAGFSLNGQGQLTYIPGSTQPLSGKPNTSPEQIGFSTDGSVLVVTEKAAGVIDTYTVSRSGIASPADDGALQRRRAIRLRLHIPGLSHPDRSRAPEALSSYAVSDSGSLRT